MSYCRWSSRCEDGNKSDVYVFHNCSGGITVYIAGYRPRRWYDKLSVLSDAAIAADNMSLWVVDETKPPHVYPSGYTSPQYKLRGGWWRFPVHRILSWLMLPRISKMWFFWPHSWTHRPIALPEMPERHGLSYLEAANYLEELRAKGYYVPMRAIETLKEEDKDDPGGPTQEEGQP